MMNIKTNEKVSFKICPLLRETCKRHECMWFLSDRICAIARIAVRLNALVEGVPVVELVGGEGDES